MRWVLDVDLNPGGIAGGSGGQYFVGTFDGTRFTNDDPPHTDALGRLRQGLLRHPLLLGPSAVGRPPHLDGLDEQLALRQRRAHVALARRAVGAAGPRPAPTARGPAPRAGARGGARDAARERRASLVVARARPCRAPPTSSSSWCSGAWSEAGLRLSNDAGEEVVVGVAREPLRGVRGPPALAARPRSTRRIRAGTRARCAGADDRVTLRVLFDRTTLEVFANDGETVVSERVYPTRPLDRLEVLGAGTAVPGASAPARAAVGVAMSAPRPQRLYGGVEGGGTKFICVVGRGPDDVRAEARVSTTTPVATLRRGPGVLPRGRRRATAAWPRSASARSARWTSRRRRRRCGFITSTPKPGWANTDVAGPFRQALGVPVALRHRRERGRTGRVALGRGAGPGHVPLPHRGHRDRGRRARGRPADAWPRPSRRWVTCASPTTARPIRFRAPARSTATAWRAWPAGRLSSRAGERRRDAAARITRRGRSRPATSRWPSSTSSARSLRSASSIGGGVMDQEQLFPLVRREVRGAPQRLRAGAGDPRGHGRLHRSAGAGQQGGGARRPRPRRAQHIMASDSFDLIVIGSGPGTLPSKTPRETATGGTTSRAASSIRPQRTFR